MPTTAGAQPAPILLSFDGPEPQRRWTVLIRLVLAVPHILIVYLLEVAAEVLAVVGWFGALFTGQLPDFVYEFECGALDWVTRVDAYVFLLTDRYPPFDLGPADYPVRLAVPPRQRLNRAAVFFRLVLAVPAALVVGVTTLGSSTIVLFVAWLVVLVSGQMPPSLYWAYAAVIRLQVRYFGWFGMLTAAYPVRGMFGDRPELAVPWPAPGGPGPGPGPGAAVPPFGPWPGAGQPVVGPPPVGAPGVPMPVPDVFTYGGTTYLWGYTADRQVCGVWRRDQPAVPPEWWPIDRQVEGWARFRQLEPAAVEYQGPSPAALGFTPPPGFAGAPTGFGVGPGGLPSYPPLASAWGPPAPGWSPTTTPGSGGALVLEPASRGLVWVFIVLGVLSYIGYGTSLRHLSSHSNSARRNATEVPLVQSDFATLRQATQAFERRSEQCRSAGTALSCLTAADGEAARAFTAFGDDIHGVPMFTTSASTARSRLVTISARVAAILSAQAAASSPQQYDQLAGGSALQQALDAFDSDYDQLVAAMEAS